MNALDVLFDANYQTQSGDSITAFNCFMCAVYEKGSVPAGFNLNIFLNKIIDVYKRAFKDESLDLFNKLLCDKISSDPLISTYGMEENPTLQLRQYFSDKQDVFKQYLARQKDEKNLENMRKVIFILYDAAGAYFIFSENDGGENQRNLFPDWYYNKEEQIGGNETAVSLGSS